MHRPEPSPSPSSAGQPPAVAFSRAESSPHRDPGLDLLRLIAVVLVIFNHANFAAVLFPSVVRVCLEALRRGGWVGVDLFFVLSGFLVSSLLFDDQRRHGRAAIGRFLIRRGFKIYPAFWVFTAYVCSRFIYHGVPISYAAFFGELLFLQNYLGQLVDHTWSLAVEEHFYLGLALMVFLSQRRQVKNPFSYIPVIFLVLTAICLLLRIMTAQVHPEFDWRVHQAPSHLRIDSLFFGVLIAYGVFHHGLLDRIRRWPPVLLQVLGFILFLPPFLLDRADHPWLHVWGYNLLYIGAGLLLLGTMGVIKSPGPVTRLLALLGSASYSIYLWHWIFNTWALKLTVHTSLFRETAYLGAYLVFSLFGGLLMARLVEMPMLRLRDRFFKPKGIFQVQHPSAQASPGGSA